VSGYPGAYLRWQARDVLRGPGIVAAIIAGFFAFVVWRLPAGAAGAAGAATLLGAYLQQVGWPMVLVATGEMVRSDRTEGYYRFYFARPIQPSLFYLVRFLLGFALVLAVVGVAAFAVWARTGSSGLDGRLLAQVGLTYLLLGGLVFLLSTVTTSGPRDWLIALIIQVFQAMSSELLATGVINWRLIRWLHTILPPTHRLDAAFDSADVLHAGLYGLGLVAVAVLILHRRPLGGGARD
jgi:hypothetical protein